MTAAIYIAGEVAAILARAMRIVAA